MKMASSRRLKTQIPRKDLVTRSMDSNFEQDQIMDTNSDPDQTQEQDYVDSDQVGVGEDGSPKPEVCRKGIDTTDAFHSVFQGKTQFNSWEEFITPFEGFQLMTNSVFKPKSSVCVNWINEKRTRDKIPARFVYCTVTMICQQFGKGVRKEGSTRKTESYVGQGCQACVRLSYKKGFLHITQANLVHSNHSLDKTNAQSQMRKIRPVVFDDELDILICRIAEDCNVFETRTSETNWQNAVSQLGQSEPKLEHLTRRMLKKRLNFLMDRFAANCEDRKPLEDDEMGVILHQLLQQKEAAMGSTRKGKKNKRKLSSGVSPRPRGRPRKALNYHEEDDVIEDSGVDNASLGDMEDDDEAPRTSNSREKTMAYVDVSALLDYWTQREANDHKMRVEELKLRKEELELQKSKFELEQKERLNLMELLKTQSQIMANLRKQPQTTTTMAVSTPQKSVTKEFILNKDGTLQPVIHEHEDPNKGSQQTQVMNVQSHNMPQQQHNTNMTTHSTPIAHHGQQQTMPGHSHSGPVQVHGHTVTMHGHAGGMPGHPSTMATHPHQAMATPGHIL